MPDYKNFFKLMFVFNLTSCQYITVISIYWQFSHPTFGLSRLSDVWNLKWLFWHMLFNIVFTINFYFKWKLIKNLLIFLNFKEFSKMEILHLYWVWCFFVYQNIFGSFRLTYLYLFDSWWLTKGRVKFLTGSVQSTKVILIKLAIIIIFEVCSVLTSSSYYEL